MRIGQDGENPVKMKWNAVHIAEHICDLKEEELVIIESVYTILYSLLCCQINILSLVRDVIWPK